MSIEDELLDLIKRKGIFSEYLPSNFNLNIKNYNIYGWGASYKDIVEPYSYNMSRLNNTGDRRIISIPELSGFISFMNYLRDNNQVLTDIIEISNEDVNSLSRFVIDNEIVEDDSQYGEQVEFITEVEETENDEYEKEHSVFMNNMLTKIDKSSGACGVLHIDISEFYRNIYTHTLTATKLGADKAKQLFFENSVNNVYVRYVNLDKMIRSLNGKRTNGLLVGPYISRIISEAVLARVDCELRDENLNFMRYADDYEFYIYQDDEIEKVKTCIVKTFSKYYFNINNEKTKYEKYPFYIFSNYEKLISSIKGNSLPFQDYDIIELFNEFWNLEKRGDKGAIRYLLKSYKNVYCVKNRFLYGDYLINVLCNDEKALGISAKIIIDEYENHKLTINSNSKKIIIKKLLYELSKEHDLEVVWLVYIAKYLEIDLEHEIIEQILKSENDLAKIIVLHEFQNKISNDDIAQCWDESCSWIFLYEIARLDENKYNKFYNKLHIVHNKNFYDKLFNNGFTFYKTRQEMREDMQNNDLLTEDNNQKLPFD